MNDKGNISENNCGEAERSQDGDQTLKKWKQSFQHDVQELFSYALRGGTMGVFLNETLSLHFVNDHLPGILGFTYDQFIEACNGGTLSLIHPEERQGYLASIQKSVSDDKHFDRVIRVQQHDGSFLWMRDVGKLIHEEGQEDTLLILRSDVTDVLSYYHELECKAKVYEEKSRQLEALTANIPGGVCEVALDDGYTLVYGNDGFYDLFGYTREQMKEEHHNRLFDLIYPQDRQFVKKTIEDAYLQEKRGFEFEYRTLMRDGSVSWVLVRGNFSEFRKRKLLNCVVVDITARKKMEDESRISEKRFQIALSQTSNTIFEYDIRTRVMIHGDRSVERYGLQQRTENVPYILLENGVVHPDSAEVFLEMYDRIHTGTTTANCTILARLTNGGYAWQKITMTTIFDDNGTPIQAIGFLEDIDEQVRREETLRYQSERDDLTDLYNRSALTLRVNQELGVDKANLISALFIIDVDDFKKINDRYGHMFGDFVLSESARRTSQIFPNKAVIGRIGGDEFIVFIHDLLSEVMIHSYSKKITAAFHHEFSNCDVTAKITCSVGSATSPQDGSVFDELYRRADIALYEAKKNGKNHAARFTTSMASELPALK